MTSRQKAEVQLILEPSVRAGHTLLATTIGDVLDADPGTEPCRVRTRWFKRQDQRGGIYSHPCGSKLCAWCVVPYLVDRIAPAWVWWSEGATIHDFEGDTRERRRFKPRSHDNPPGMLWLGDKETMSVIEPGGSLRGDILMKELRDRVRVLKLDSSGKEMSREPNDYFGTVPRRATPDTIRRAAETAGGEIYMLENGRWAFENWTEDVNHRFVELLWQLSYAQ